MQDAFSTQIQPSLRIQAQKTSLSLDSAPRLRHPRFRPPRLNPRLRTWIQHPDSDPLTQTRLRHILRLQTQTPKSDLQAQTTDWDPQTRTQAQLSIKTCLLISLDLAASPGLPLLITINTPT